MIQFMDRLALLLSRLGTIPAFLPGMTWREWAAAVVFLPAIARFNPPDPHQFSEWLPWALEFNKTVVVNVQ